MLVPSPVLPLDRDSFLSSSLSPLISYTLCLLLGTNISCRARELLAASAADGSGGGGLSEQSGEAELVEAESVLAGLVASPVAYGEEQVSLRISVVRICILGRAG